MITIKHEIKIPTTFGQNIKISEKFWYVLKKLLYLSENYVMLGKNFWYVRQNFRMLVEKYLICLLIWLFLVCLEKHFWWSRPPPRQHFWGEILMFSLSVCPGKLYSAPPPTNKIRPIRPCWKLFARIIFRGVLKFAPPALREF